MTESEKRVEFEAKKREMLGMELEQVVSDVRSFPGSVEALKRLVQIRLNFLIERFGRR